MSFNQICCLFCRRLSAAAGSGDGISTATDPTDDFTGNITNFTATVSGTTVNFTWSYQGSATFELEQEDTSDPSTNFAFVQGPTGRSASVGGLNPGDNYLFRIRADRSDGTVSADGTTVALTALGADASGAANLTYTWATPTIPTGAGSPTFSDNGDNSASSSTAMLDYPGSYTFAVTITNASGNSITSDVNVTVNQVPTLSVSPTPATVGAGKYKGDIHLCIPYGPASWVQATARRMGLLHTLRPRGRQANDS